MHTITGAQQHTRTSVGSAALQPTREQFDAYRGMFVYFNEALFGGCLPEVVLNFSRHARTNGFFAPERWHHASGAAHTHEISLNPDTLMERDPRAVASTLVHEMCHLWQHVHGTPPRKSYHDRQWASKMESVGLIPSSTGAPGGKRVGSKMTHYIEEGGAFARAYEAMPQALALPWRSSPLVSPRRGGRGGAEPGGEPAPTKPRDPSKLKYSCPSCCANVWGKPGLNLLCGDCPGERFVCATADEPPAELGDGPHGELPESMPAAPSDLLGAIEVLCLESNYFPLRIGDHLDLTQDGMVHASVRIDHGSVVVGKVGQDQDAATRQHAAGLFLAARCARAKARVEMDLGDGTRKEVARAEGRPSRRARRHS
jgi:predicted SprT family Zn-dependent metalloprotease